MPLYSVKTRPMKIKQTIEKIPGGMMIIPLFLGVTINSLFPQILDIGGLTTALARGSSTLIAAFLLCMGAGINLKAVPLAAKKGAAITFSKFAIGMLIGVGVMYFSGEKGFLGLSSLAIIAGMTNSNGGLFAALASEFGDETDIGSIAIISINDGPFLTMIALGSAGLANFPILSIVSVLLPLVIGIILGNLDDDLRKFLLKGGFVLIPFFAFSLGAALNFSTIFQAGLSGILLGVLCTVVGGFFNILADRFVGGTGIAGAAASSTAGNAVATPAALVLADPSLTQYAEVATSQIAAAVITTIILTPLLTQFVVKRFGLKRAN
jgi:2-keto-3-deoxygluconate permease